MKTDDLLMDDRFVQWVLHPNEELDYYWNQWMLDHPNDTGAAHDARTFIQKIYKQEAENLQEASLVSIKDRAWERVKRSVQYDVLRPKRLWGAWRQVAAAVLILAVLAALFIYKPSKTGGKNYAYNGVVYENRGKQLSKKNVSNSASTVYLPDGSRVILDPGAGIEYEALLNGEHRIITLKGSAFFDVAKDSSRPFIIHTTKADVRVLGTSFKIRETPQNGNTQGATAGNEANGAQGANGGAAGGNAGANTGGANNAQGGNVGNGQNGNQGTTGEGNQGNQGTQGNGQGGDGKGAAGAGGNNAGANNGGGNNAGGNNQGVAGAG